MSKPSKINIQKYYNFQHELICWFLFVWRLRFNTAFIYIFANHFNYFDYVYS